MVNGPSAAMTFPFVSAVTQEQPGASESSSNIKTQVATLGDATLTGAAAAALSRQGSDSGGRNHTEFGGVHHDGVSFLTTSDSYWQHDRWSRWQRFSDSIAGRLALND